MHIVLKWISAWLSPSTRFLLDSAFVGIYGNCRHAYSHTHTCTPPYGRMCTLAKTSVLLKLFLGVLLPSSSLHLLSASFFHLFLHHFPTLSPSLTLLSSFAPLRLAFSAADYLALIQNVIKENDRLPQIPLSFLPSALSSFLSVSVFLLDLLLWLENNERMWTVTALPVRYSLPTTSPSPLALQSSFPFSHLLLSPFVFAGVLYEASSLWSIIMNRPLARPG